MLDSGKEYRYNGITSYIKNFHNPHPSLNEEIVSIQTFIHFHFLLSVRAGSADQIVINVWILYSRPEVVISRGKIRIDVGIIHCLWKHIQLFHVPLLCLCIQVHVVHVCRETSLTDAVTHTSILCFPADLPLTQVLPLKMADLYIATLITPTCVAIIYVMFENLYSMNTGFKSSIYLNRR